ncbi:MAG: ABC transporter ATP-binding protein [Akkermansiaceae bacterium]|mgnify:CR=1 FL=1|jgi:putative ABC transport system ATP-binding protein|nr:ABC transporter ATP-binding protein [Akkermansiaceae bacterium]
MRNEGTVISGEKTVLTVQDFSKSFGEVVALDKISLSVEVGEIVVLCGSSGAGKSTLLYMVAGLLPPDSGIVELAGIDPYGLSSSERTLLRGRGIGMVFQDARLLSYLDIEANILAGGGSPDRARELIEELGLGDRRSHVPKKLSAGEQQRVGLARALVANPKLLLADEPTGNLDQGSTDLVLAGLKKYVSDGGAALVVTHDPQVIKMADRVLTLEKGILQG